MIKLANLLNKGMLAESPRLTKLIYSGASKPPVSLEDYTKQYGSTNPAQMAANQHFKGVNPKNILVFAAKDKAQADAIRKAQQQNDVLGIWADPTTLIVSDKQ